MSKSFCQVAHRTSYSRIRTFQNNLHRGVLTCERLLSKIRRENHGCVCIAVPECSINLVGPDSDSFQLIFSRQQVINESIDAIASLPAGPHQGKRMNTARVCE